MALLSTPLLANKANAVNLIHREKKDLKTKEEILVYVLSMIGG
jgi:hypothetical protein